ncbi:DnaJ domain [Trypanosoma melophagium]|uniref:DnaJ domain n=1 Tax=Trypanosoma melophagium TaxID=715481 RepID=UPI003519DEAB|nr:DnaJ domain [Trypanosoma melophagium]
MQIEHYRCGRFLFFVIAAILLLSVEKGNGSSSKNSGVPDDESTKTLLLAGDAALRQGRSQYQEALAKYTEALAHNPKSLRGLYSRAEILSMMRQREPCMQDLNQLLELDGEHHRGLALRASLHTQSGHIQEAIRDIERLIPVLDALKKSAKAAEYRSKLNQLRRYVSMWPPLQRKLQDSVQRGGSPLTPAEYRSCVAVLQEMIRDFARDNVELRLQRAKCALACGDNAAASEELKSIVRRDPQNLEAVALAARALRALGALEAARADLRRCLSLDPEHAACAAGLRGVREQQRLLTAVKAAMDAGDFVAAGKHVDAAEKLAKEEARALGIPVTQSSTGSGDGMVGDTALREQVRRWRCDVAVGRRDTKEGHKACDAVLERLGGESPAAADVLLQKVELYLMDDNIATAEEYLGRVQKIQASHPRLQEYLRKVEKLKRSAGRKDYYKTLGVKKTADAAEIRRAYRQLAKTLHPDKLRSQNLSPKERQKADERFRNINEAKEILLDDEKRARYDNGEDPTKPPGQQGDDGHPFYGHPFTFHGNPFGQGGPFGHGGGHQQFFFRFG